MSTDHDPKDSLFASSYFFARPAGPAASDPNDPDDGVDSARGVASLPSSSVAASELAELDDGLDDSSYVSDNSDSDADAEWRESLQQLELMLTLVLVPFFGKFIGRKCAYWGASCYHLACLVGLVCANRVDRVGEGHGVEVSG